MREEGFKTEMSADKKTLKIVGQYFDAKGRILEKTNDMVARTIKLNEYYQNQVQFLKNATNLEVLDGKQ